MRGAVSVRRFEDTAAGREVVGGGGKGSNAKRSFTFCATWSNQVCAKHHHSLHSEALSASFGEEAEVVKAFAPVVLSSG